MSRIGNRILKVPEGVTVTTNGNIVTVKGPKGELSTEINKHITVEVNDQEVVIKRDNDKSYNFTYSYLKKLIIIVVTILMMVWAIIDKIPHKRKNPIALQKLLGFTISHDKIAHNTVTIMLIE